MMDTVFSHLVERLLYRYLQDDKVVEETYSLKYDEQGRLIETRSGSRASLYGGK